MRLINADAISYESIDSSDTGRHEHYYGTGIIAVRKEDIDAMPTIQPEPHWIPVTERLPEEDQPVLVTDGAVMWVCSLIRTDDGYKWENNMGYWHDFDEWKAWMPLPKPYKGVTE